MNLYGMYFAQECTYKSTKQGEWELCKKLSHTAIHHKKAKEISSGSLHTEKNTAKKEWQKWRTQTGA